eukprot:GCRY01005983.1.p1 GENE.GCRY01005983.1~~GCRY01005983.1.p1  ORF type:complete len:240 (-),score=14.21 GCRY01005983.1:311-1030(-)
MVLSTAVNNVLTSLSEKLFQKSNGILLQPEQATQKTEIASSVFLQMMMYYNFIYDFMFFPLSFHAFIWKANNEDNGFAFYVANVLRIGLWLLLEPIRLSFGYSGNLRERVPQLAGFFVLSIPQTILTLLGLIQSEPLALDVALNIMLLILLVPQVLISFFVAKRLIRARSAYFYLENWSLVNEAEMREIEGNGDAQPSPGTLASSTGAKKESKKDSFGLSQDHDPNALSRKRRTLGSAL